MGVISKSIKATVLALSVSLPTLAWAGIWEGQWQSGEGEIRLIENGNMVYGDVGTASTIKGTLSHDKQFLRATVTSQSGQSRYVEFKQYGDMGGTIKGRYVLIKPSLNPAEMPSTEFGSEVGTEWRARQTQMTQPTLSVYKTKRQDSLRIDQAPSQSGPTLTTGSTTLQTGGNGNDILRKRPSRIPNIPKHNLASVENPTVKNWLLYSDWTQRASRETARDQATRENKKVAAIADIRQKQEAAEQARREAEAVEIARQKDAALRAAELRAAEDAKYAESDALKARIQLLKDYPRGFEPKWIDIQLAYMSVTDPTDRFDVELYGDIQVKMACHTTTGQTQLLPFGGLSNKVFNATRDDAVQYSTRTRRARLTGQLLSGSNYGWYNTRNENDTIRRFKFDKACLSVPDNRLSIEVVSNLVEKDKRPALDDRLGRHTKRVYLDALDTKERANRWAKNASEISGGENGFTLKWQMRDIGPRNNSHQKLEFYVDFVE